MLEAKWALKRNGSSQAHLSEQDMSGRNTMMDELFDNKNLLMPMPPTDLTVPWPRNDTVGAPNGS